MKPSPHLLRRALAVALAAALAAAGGCSKGGDDRRAADRATTTSALPPPPPPALAFTITAAEANGTAPPDEATTAAIKQSLDGWLATAVVAPLHTGSAAGDLSGAFTAAAVERLTDPAVRATLVDEGLPPATKGIAAEALDAALFSVAGPDGVVGVVAARVNVRVRASGAAGDVDVVHQGELVLVPDADTWKIDSFTLHTTRDSRP